jgi:replicative DNA helicase
MIQSQLHKTEEAIIGSIIYSWAEHQNVFSLLRYFHFDSPTHKTIYNALERLNSSNRPIDTITLSNELKLMGSLEQIGGAYELTRISQNNLFSNLESHCYIVLEAYLRTSVQQYANKLLSQSKDIGSDIFDIISQAEKEISDIVKNVVTKPIDTLEDVKNEVVKEMYEVVRSGKKSGILTSIIDLNEHTQGWQKQNLIILAGRPGMGKTAAALDFVLTPSLLGHKVAFFSLEMSKEELTGRALSVITSVNVQNIINKSVTLDQVMYIEKEAVKFNKVPFYIDDSPSLSVFSLRNKARKLKREQGLDLIVIDYLQLMTVKSNSKSGNREQEISEISRGLKALAKELDIPIIALAQLSRAVEARPDKKPMLSDLRESGAIEQDADMIIFPFRPEYYGHETYQFGNEQLRTEQLLIWIIGKFRNGSTGEIKSRFIGDNTMVVNYETTKIK